MKLNREQLINSVLKNPALFTAHYSSERKIAERVKRIVDEIIKIESEQEEQHDTDPPTAEPRTLRQLNAFNELRGAKASFKRASDQFTLTPTLPGTDVGCYSIKTIQDVEEVTLPNQVPSPPRGRRES